jgi:DNA-binding MarR family transcriptional regulator
MDGGQDMHPPKPATPAPGPERPPDTAVRELIRTFGLLEQVMHPYFARFGISGSQWAVLRNLHRAEQAGEGGLRLTDLGARLLVRPPSVTGVVDRLERVGLVRREGVPTDLRAKQVVLTPKGRKLVGQVLAGHADQIARLMAPLKPDEERQLAGLLHRLGRHLEGLLGK